MSPDVRDTREHPPPCPPQPADRSRSPGPALRKAAVIEATLNIAAGKGFQGRGSARMSLVAGRFASRIVLVTDSGSADAHDVMAVMRLRTPPGTVLRIQADDPAEVAAVRAIARLLGPGNGQP